MYELKLETLEPTILYKILWKIFPSLKGNDHDVIEIIMKKILLLDPEIESLIKNWQPKDKSAKYSHLDENNQCSNEDIDRLECLEREGLNCSERFPKTNQLQLKDAEKIYIGKNESKRMGCSGGWYIKEIEAL